MKLTGKWTPEERKMAMNVIYFFVLQDLAAGRVEAAKLIGVVSRLCLLLNGRPKDLVDLRPQMQRLFDGLGPDGEAIIASWTHLYTSGDN